MASHPDHANTITITSLMKGHTDIFGYVSVGVTNSESIASLQTRVDNWKNLLNADGIFFDEFGFDFRLTGYTDAQVRVRQKAMIDYAHSLGLKVFVNAFDPDDVFTKEPSNPLTWQTGDNYLYESYIFSFATRETFAAYRAKMAKLTVAKAATGVQMYAISSTAAPASSFVQADYDYMILSAAADNLDGISWGTDLFSSVSAIMPYRTNLDLLKKFASPGVTVDSTAQSLTFTHPNGTYRLDYGTPAFTKLN